MKRKTRRKIVYKPVEITYEPAKIAIRCIWNGRLIIPADQTPSSTRYDFQFGQVQSVDAQDYNFLLSKEKKQKGCCGSSGQIIKYFEEVT